MKMIAAVFAAGMLSWGVAQATASTVTGQNQSQDQQSPQKRAAPVVAGASAATTASTGGITAATVVGVGIVVGAVALIAIGANHDGHHGGGTTGTH